MSVETLEEEENEEENGDDEEADEVYESVGDVPFEEPTEDDKGDAGPVGVDRGDA